MRTLRGPAALMWLALISCRFDGGGSQDGGVMDAADHVGIGSDFDGGGGVAGFATHADAPAVTRGLLARGFSEEQVAKIWGGNLLRVWSEVESVAARRQ